MGRMADARKRARRKGGPKQEKPPVAEKSPGETRAARSEAAPTDSAPADDADASAELVFPAEPAPAAAPSGALVLPSSGLASEILNSEAARGLEPPREEPAPAPAAPRASPSPDDASASRNFSFFSAPAREEKAVAEASEHLATFFLHEEEYGLPVRLVQEIIRVTDITQVPRAPEFIKGVINLRGRIIPVVDLRRKLGLGDVETTRQTRIVVVSLDGRLIGLLVDGASQVLRVPVSSIEAAPEEVVEIDSNFIRGVAKLEKRLIILIDLSQILARELREAGAIAAEDGGAR
jgi:purine-binding chemotaxis protein CheW